MKRPNKFYLFNTATRSISLRRQQFLRRVATALLCIVSISGVMFLVMDNLFISFEKQIMRHSAQNIASLDFDDPAYEAILADIEANHNFYIEIYSPRDTLIYTTDSNRVLFEPSEDDKKTELQPKIMKFISRQELEDGSYFEIRQEYYATALHLVYGSFFGENCGVEIYSSIDALTEHAMIAGYVILAFAVFLSIAICIIAELYIRMFTRPLIIINNTTKEIAGMNFTNTCPPFKTKELNELGTNINNLSGSLETALRKLKSENIQLEKDIEIERRMEKVMRTFVANASHELKTPISVIQAYAEGMKFGIGCDSTEQFCDIIIDETQKMNTLVVRLMEYLNYDSKAYKPKTSTFNLKSLITENLVLQSRKIEKAYANITVDIDESFYVNGDSEMVLTVFNNYFSNALSHLDFDRNIKISAQDKGDRYTVSVFNSGKPIAESDIDNIWQSFYRGDKSHSRAEGRFGLGLSIVATIQKLFDQKYGVVNLGNGVKFWFDVKKGSIGEETK